MTKHKTFSKEFKLEAVRLLELSDKPSNDIAMEDMGIHRNMLHKWQDQLKKHGDNAFQGPGRHPVDQNGEAARLRKELAEVKLERDILKSCSVLCERPEVEYAFLGQHRKSLSIVAPYNALKVSHSGDCDWCNHGESQHSARDRTLLKHICRVYNQSRPLYGVVKYRKQFNNEGTPCGRDCNARLRCKHKVFSKRCRRFVVTTRSKHKHWIAPNRLKLDFSSVTPDRIWVGGDTFIASRAGWLYLAVLLDLFLRKLITWSMSNNNNGKLAQDALDMAVRHHQPNEGLIHYTDRGSTYAMKSYRETLSRYGMISSVSRKRDFWVNAVVESFFLNLKKEIIYWYNISACE